MKSKLPRSLSPIVAILLLAAFLRFYRLSAQSLWSDEGNSAALARRGFAEIAQRAAFDIHPPLYYWLLKIWVAVFSDSEAGLRSLSAALGVALVYVVWRLGRSLFGNRVGLIAAFIAALSPLQVYYSQEARMYMPLALLGSLTVLTALFIFEDYANQELHTTYHLPPATYSVARRWVLRLSYILVVAAGLYTHYAYPLMLLVVNLPAVIWLTHPPKPKTQNSKLINWLALQLIPLLLYLPWLPIAWRQITTWPSERQIGSLGEQLAAVSTTLLFGLSWPGNSPWPATAFLGLVLALVLWRLTGDRRAGGQRSGGAKEQGLRNTHYAPQRTTQPATLLLLWLLLPIILTFLIFSPAFLKFLLVAAPPLAILMAVALVELAAAVKRRWAGYTVSGAGLLALSVASTLSLYHYYNNPAFARDDYRGIVQFIKAVGGPKDAIILNAEGQQDVFDYYYRRSPVLAASVYPLPRQRPLDEASTLAELQAIADASPKVYTVYWAAQQADPQALIEGWLDTHLFKATDKWYGNVRLVSYASPQASANLKLNPVDVQFDPDIRLTGYAVPALQIAPGDILQAALQWQTGAPLAGDYTVFLQVLDANNHLVGQRDARPLIPTTEWLPGQPIRDAHGVFIEPGTPPGPHRLIMGLYNSQTGQRLPLAESGVDFIELAQVEIIRPAVPLPPGAFDIQTPLYESLLGVSLLGYDFYKAGHRSSPDTPLHPGDPAQLVAYWTPNGPARQFNKVGLNIGVKKINGADTPVRQIVPLAGVHYPRDHWQPGEIVRAQYSFFLSGLEPGLYRLELTVYSPNSLEPAKALTRPFQIE